MLQREPLSLAAQTCGQPGQAKACPSCPQEQKQKKRSIHVLHKPDSFTCFLHKAVINLANLRVAHPAEAVWKVELSKKVILPQNLSCRWRGI